MNTNEIINRIGKAKMMGRKVNFNYTIRNRLLLLHVSANYTGKAVVTINGQHIRFINVSPTPITVPVNLPPNAYLLCVEPYV